MTTPLNRHAETNSHRSTHYSTAFQARRLEYGRNHPRTMGNALPFLGSPLVRHRGPVLASAVWHAADG